MPFATCRYARKFLLQSTSPGPRPTFSRVTVPPLMKPGAMRERTVDELSIRDEQSFRHVSLYYDLKEVLRRSGYRFRVLPNGRARWDRALLLNLTFWRGHGGDVLESQRVAADVVMHAAWHHLAARVLATSATSKLSTEALFLGESIASAFDIYLVGRLLHGRSRSSFLETQVPAMADAAKVAGLSKAAFQRLLREVAADPERAFADLRALLYDATMSLFRSRDADAALAVLVRFERHRFGALLHHYELSNWVLVAQAQEKRGRRPDRRAAAVDVALRRSETPVTWLTSRWVAPALAARLTCP
jgi:hypothetical protein